MNENPFARRAFLTLGAAALLSGCATPSPTPSASPPRPRADPTPAPAPARTPSTSDWPPTPRTPTPGVCPTLPDVLAKPGNPQQYLPCEGTNIALTIDDGP